MNLYYQRYTDHANQYEFLEFLALSLHWANHHYSNDATYNWTAANESDG